MTARAYLVRPQGAADIARRWFHCSAVAEAAQKRYAVGDLGHRVELVPLSATTPAVADLVHLAAGAYIADRNTARLPIQPRPCAHDR